MVVVVEINIGESEGGRERKGEDGRERKGESGRERYRKMKYFFSFFLKKETLPAIALHQMTIDVLR